MRNLTQFERLYDLGKVAKQINGRQGFPSAPVTHVLLLAPLGRLWGNQAVLR